MKLSANLLAKLAVTVTAAGCGSHYAQTTPSYVIVQQPQYVEPQVYEPVYEPVYVEPVVVEPDYAKPPPGDYRTPGIPLRPTYAPVYIPTPAPPPAHYCPGCGLG